MSVYLKRSIPAALTVAFVIALAPQAPAQSAPNNDQRLAQAGGKFVCQKAKERNRSRVALFPFQDAEGEESPAAQAIATGVIAILTQCEGVQVIERARTEQVLEEQSLGQSGLIDASTAPQIGQMVGADTLVFGASSPGQLLIRLVDASSGQVLGATVAGGAAANPANPTTSEKPADPPAPTVTVQSGAEVERRFRDDQIAQLLRRALRRRPALFVYLVSTDAELSAARGSHPRFNRRLNGLLSRMNAQQKMRLDALRAETLRRRSEDPAIEARLLAMRQRLELRRVD